MIIGKFQSSTQLCDLGCYNSVTTNSSKSDLPPTGKLYRLSFPHYRKLPFRRAYIREKLVVREAQDPDYERPYKPL